MFSQQNTSVLISFTLNFTITLILPLPEKNKSRNGNVLGKSVSSMNSILNGETYMMK